MYWTNIPTHSPLHVTYIQLGVGVSLVVLEELVFRNDSGAIIAPWQKYEEISKIKKESARNCDKRQAFRILMIFCTFLKQ